MPIVLKSGSLSLLEPSGLVQACNGIALRDLYRHNIPERMLEFCSVILLTETRRNDDDDENDEGSDDDDVLHVSIFMHHLQGISYYVC